MGSIDLNFPQHAGKTLQKFAMCRENDNVFSALFKLELKFYQTVALAEVKAAHSLNLLKNVFLLSDVLSFQKCPSCSLSKEPFGSPYAYLHVLYFHHPFIGEHSQENKPQT